MSGDIHDLPHLENTPASKSGFSGKELSALDSRMETASKGMDKTPKKDALTSLDPQLKNKVEKQEEDECQSILTQFKAELEHGSDEQSRVELRQRAQGFDPTSSKLRNDVEMALKFNNFSQNILSWLSNMVTNPNMIKNGKEEVPKMIQEFRDKNTVTKEMEPTISDFNKTLGLIVESDTEEDKEISEVIDKIKQEIGGIKNEDCKKILKDLANFLTTLVSPEESEKATVAADTMKSDIGDEVRKEKEAGPASVKSDIEKLNKAGSISHDEMEGVLVRFVGIKDYEAMLSLCSSIAPLQNKIQGVEKNDYLDLAFKLVNLINTENADAKEVNEAIQEIFTKFPVVKDETRTNEKGFPVPKAVKDQAKTDSLITLAQVLEEKFKRQEVPDEVEVREYIGTLQDRLQDKELTKDKLQEIEKEIVNNIKFLTIDQLKEVNGYVADAKKRLK